MSASSFFSSFFNTVHGDAQEEQPENEHKEEEVAEAGEQSQEAEEVEAEDVSLHSRCVAFSLLIALLFIGSPYHSGRV